MVAHLARRRRRSGEVAIAAAAAVKPVRELRRSRPIRWRWRRRSAIGLRIRPEVVRSVHRDLSPRSPPAGETDKLFCKLAYFYRADCVFDLGNFEESIKLYDNAAFRYQDDPSALAAYVQIVNAYCALGKDGGSEDGQRAGEMAIATNAARIVCQRRVYHARGVLGQVAAVDECGGDVVRKMWMLVVGC